MVVLTWQKEQNLSETNVDRRLWERGYYFVVVLLSPTFFFSRFTTQIFFFSLLRSQKTPFFTQNANGIQVYIWKSFFSSLALCVDPNIVYWNAWVSGHMLWCHPIECMPQSLWHQRKKKFSKKVESVCTAQYTQQLCIKRYGCWYTHTILKVSTFSLAFLPRKRGTNQMMKSFARKVLIKQSFLYSWCIIHKNTNKWTLFAV